MNAQSAQIEVVAELNANLADAASASKSEEALKELSGIELAYVGGGTASFAWF